MMAAVGDWAIPCVLFGIVVYAFLNGADVFSEFIEGAKEGLHTSINILPALIALITAVGIFKASGALDLITHFISPLTEKLGMPAEVVPLALLRPISGSGAMVIFNDILETHGPDSLPGRIASVMQGSTETTFYTIAVYYGATRIKNTRHTVPSSVTADIVGFVMSALIVRIFFGY